MAFDAVTQIFDYMDAVTLQIVAENVSRMIAWVTPLAALGLTIMLVIDGVATMLRPSGVPLTHLVEKFLKYYAIVGIAGAGGLYETTLASTAIHLPDELASKLLMHGSLGASNSAIASLIDGAIDHSLTVMRTVFANSSLLTSTGIGAFILGIVLVLSTLLICGVGAVSILIAKFLLALSVCFGPFFIFMLLAPPLANLFGNWLGSVLNYVILIAITAMSFGVFMHFYDSAISAAAKPNPDAAIIGPIITAGLVTVMALGLLKVLPDLAARWTNGVKTNFDRFLPQPSSSPAAPGGGGGSPSGGNNGGSAGAGSGSNSGGGSAGGYSSSGSGYSYARGSQGSAGTGSGSNSGTGSAAGGSSSSGGGYSYAQGSQGSQNRGT
ncbi:TPA: type IV secretion system protein [Burkholderia territorii]|uniref:type IV secretion system protein n=1 Tax=Burkholderia territorii TaxID=1503055 RepID=UPI0011C942F3|nr:type IV secretion system protein [Burkholderia territorii]TXG26766.1 type IV secretion system protein [Burkholderia territorii]HDR8856743.1 type IV secretion system protein [Burkholderia territorii]HDR8862668.1 type IV secretion system protein [Burkholderia territorii]HDR8868819.1 type IV secretion system protein [Burkholderia territorii]HDR8875519.1 type IV secretion system protein [Burkholderia territorii]